MLALVRRQPAAPKLGERVVELLPALRATRVHAEAIRQPRARDAPVRNASLAREREVHVAVKAGNVLGEYERRLDPVVGRPDGLERDLDHTHLLVERTTLEQVPLRREHPLDRDAEIVLPLPDPGEIRSCAILVQGQQVPAEDEQVVVDAVPRNRLTLLLAPHKSAERFHSAAAQQFRHPPEQFLVDREEDERVHGRGAVARYPKTTRSGGAISRFPTTIKDGLPYNWPHAARLLVLLRDFCCARRLW
jgi:hypothetical protein